MQRYGQRRPVVVNRRTGIIEAGNATWEAARALGWTHLAVVYVEDDPTTAAGYAIADNRTAELAEWDDEALARTLEALKTEGEIAHVGFDDGDLDELLRSLRPPADETFNAADALAAAPDLAERVSRGQVWKLGRHRLMCGDSTDSGDVKLLADGQLTHAVLTDPPYGIARDGITNDDPEGCPELYAAVLSHLPITNGVIAAFQSPRLFPVWLDAVRAAGHRFERALFMYKPDDEAFPWRGWISKTEVLLLSTVGQGNWQDVHPYQHDVYMVNLGQTVRSDPTGAGSRAHPTIKPLWVVNDLLRRICPHRGLVYDPFLGSGTTIIAAEQTGHACYGMEIEARYCALSIARWESYTGQSAVLDA